MTEPAVEPTQPPAAPAAPAAPAEPAQPVTPPWGDDFDPEKAWALVQNLRADKEKLAARPTLSAEQQKQLSEYNALVEASKSDAQRLQEAEATARRDAETARSDAMALRIAIKHGLSEDDIDLLGSGTEEQVNARAQRLADLRAAATPVPPTTAPGQRPVEQLRPGASPGEPVNADDAVYAALFGAPKT